MSKLLALILGISCLLVTFAFAGNNLPGGTRKADDAEAQMDDAAPSEGKKSEEKKKSPKPSPTPSKSSEDK